MAQNIADYESFIRGFMTQRIKERKPDLDTSLNSPFDDIFLTPMVGIIIPFFTIVNSVDFVRNLDNAVFMTEAEMDDLGNGNYLIARNSGVKANTTLTLSYLRVPTTENLIIPVGTTFATSTGLNFQNPNKLELTPSELALKYNSAKTTYDIDLDVEAVATGSGYNVSSNQIKTVVTKLGTNLSSVTNKIAVTSGTDKETNVDYANRIRSYWPGMHLGTKPGYTKFIKSNFPEVEDIFIAGFGDPEMQRDLMTVIKNGNPVQMHMGGKVDIYIKGCVFSALSTQITLKTSKLKLNKFFSVVDSLSVVASNLSAPTVPVVFSVTSGTNDECYVVLDETSYNVDVINQISITYNYDLGQGAQSSNEIFTVGYNQVVLSTPFKSVISILNSTDESQSLSSSQYELIRTQIDGTPILNSDDIYFGTTKENVSLKFKNLNDVLTGTTFNINYTINKTLNDLKEKFETEEDKIITTDLMYEETPPVFVNIGFQVKMKAGQTLDNSKITEINSVVAAYFDTLKLGGRVDESDIVGALYKNDSAPNYLEYILLPLDSFYVPDDPASAVELRRDGTFISVTNLQYPALNKLVVTEIT